MTTEAEAKARWCPFARVDSGYVGNGVVNRYPKREEHGGYRPDGRTEMLDAQVNCIASACMAWRWDPDQAVGEYHPDYVKTAARRRGYCGLAGKPLP